MFTKSRGWLRLEDIWRDRDLRARPNVSLLNVPLVIWVRFALRLAGDEHPCSETVKK